MIAFGLLAAAEGFVVAARSRASIP